MFWKGRVSLIAASSVHTDDWSGLRRACERWLTGVMLDDWSWLRRACEWWLSGVMLDDWSGLKRACERAWLTGGGGKGVLLEAVCCSWLMTVSNT